MNNLNLILKRPIITEKSMDAGAKGSYTFLVEKNSTKKEIKMAVEKQFKVNVISVKTITIKGKRRKTGKRRKEFQEPTQKKGIVKLLPEQKIEVFEGGGK